MGSRFSKEEIRFRKELDRIRKKNEIVERKNALRAEKRKYSVFRIQASKVFMILLFLSCSSVQVFSMMAMWHFCDLSSLPVLIGATLSEGVSLCAYFAKSYMETKEEERIKLEREKLYNEPKG